MVFTSAWTWLNGLIVFLSISVYLLAVYVYCSLLSFSEFVYYVPQVLFSDVNFWVIILFCVVATVGPEYVTMYYRRINSKSLKHIIQERRVEFGENPEKYSQYAAPEFGVKLNEAPGTTK